MSSNVVNTMPYLRTTREFPEELPKLRQQIDKSWVDAANAINARTIGIYPTNNPAITGESWFVTNNQRQQSLRQIYPFTAVGNIPHNILDTFTLVTARTYGSFTDGTNFYGAIFGNAATPIAGQITFHVTPSVGTTSGNIVIAAGAGAPAIVNGIIVLEYLSQP